MVMTAGDEKRPDGKAGASGEADRPRCAGHRPPGAGTEGGSFAEDAAAESPSPRLKLFGREIPLPASRRWRVALGASLVGGGALGFLPILGFWMLPLGLFVLSVDSPVVRRWRRRSEVRFARWRRTRQERRAGPAKGRDAEDGNG